MERFVFKGLPTRVVFGAGSFAELGAVLDSLICQRALVVTTPAQADLAWLVRERIGNRFAGAFTNARMHTPVQVTEQALTQVQAAGADCVISIGGGSTTGLGKALAVRTGRPHVAIPTTYAGSEMTDILGETGDAGKTARRSEQIRPQAVIYDPEFTLSLPVSMSVASGLNAMAHAVEALYAHDRNPITSMMAEAGLRALYASLAEIAQRPDDSAARSQALYGAWLCGTCLGSVSMALHHKVCHVLGGSFDLPHAETHAVMLHHVVAYNASAAPEAMHTISRILGSEPAPGLQHFAASLGAPTSLAELGMPEDGIDRATDLVFADSYPNPRPLDRGAVRDMLSGAWKGKCFLQPINGVATGEKP
ncbi:maleylacetate reductase [Mesorhizobium sp. M3A.F.Ca.ET.201.01.1.1]|uniref:maleylacetate reductase n=1 Tax=Mesorhizobium sp. M3A.F.Ca.ET.201.01.1.1 TaxID=2563946 RepID=UPI001093A7F9|nr:maleylacetate reductase [Mesorhizobium sp. M3A.F.Ca.ET.201.01.1.1]TGS71705.1 maleylacetate reductase [Mesorhizobium sp. M3A.F.Ca.ET.201.01.1.1]